jgi:hypothetical protein
MTNQPCVSLKKPRLSLTSADCVRLEAIALSFGVEFQQIDEATYRLRSSDAGRACDVLLSAEVAHFRLLAEICSRASKWVYFNFAVSPRDSLLRQSDARLLRVASFYRAELDAGIL